MLLCGACIGNTKVWSSTKINQAASEGQGRSHTWQSDG